MDAEQVMKKEQEYPGASYSGDIILIILTC
jgi:hypothetical protein